MYRYLDLFAGAGGLSEGFTRAGYTPVAHVEMDAAACFSLKTRAAYHWLKAAGKLDLYDRYLKQEISGNSFMLQFPNQYWTPCSITKFPLRPCPIFSER